MTKEQRYKNDNQFRMLVDTLYVGIVKQGFTPTETREAALMASILYEQRNLKGKLYKEDKTDPRPEPAEDLLMKLDHVMSSPLLESTRMDEIRSIVLKWRKQKPKLWRGSGA